MDIDDVEKVTIEDPNNYYPLGSGTDDERSVPSLKTTSLGDLYDQIFGVLRHLHNQAGSVPPLRFTIQGIWLVWCYASHDVAKLREEIKTQQKLARVVTDINTAALTELTETVARLKDQLACQQGEIQELRDRAGLTR